MSLEKYIQNKFYDEIFKQIKDYVIKNREYLKENIVYKRNNFIGVKYVKLEDFHLKRYRIIETRENIITFNAVIVANLEVKGYTKHGYEADNSDIWLESNLNFILDNGIHNFEISDVKEYDYKNWNDKVFKYTDTFIPLIKVNELDTVSEEILQKYYPRVLEEPMKLDVREFVKSLNLEFLETRLTQDNSVFGKVVFKDSNINIICNDKEETIFVKKGTILIDPEVINIRNKGSYNNTVVHECVHWILHRLHNEYKMLLNNTDATTINKLIKPKKYYWKDTEWMEWHSNSIAPRVLMPRKTVMVKVQELYLRYTDLYNEYNRTEMYELVVDELSDFYGVSKFAAKIRLIQLGYKEYEGVYKYEGSEYIKSYSFEINALENNQTYTINFKDACYLNIVNEEFKELMDLNKYVYVDSHFCLYDSKYIKIGENNSYAMTDYAYNNMDECCLKFDIKFKNKNIDFTTINDYVLCRGNNPNIEVEVDFSEYLERPDLGKNIIPPKEMMEKIAEIMRDLPTHFCGTLRVHRNRKNISQEELELYSEVGISTIRRLETDYEYRTKLLNIVSICVGLKLYPDFSLDLIEKGKCKLDNSSWKDRTYVMMLRHYYHLSIYEFKEILRSYKII